MRFASPGLTEYEARGLASNGGAAPTVGFYLDEIPLSPPAVSQSGKVVINPDLYDVQRVEVLRGPQGTLYGSGSMGGTIRVLTNEPKLGTFEGSVQATGSDTEGGSGNGAANLMMNLPIGETLAARVVLSYLYRSGWIDNITVHPFPVDAQQSVIHATAQQRAGDQQLQRRQQRNTVRRPRELALQAERGFLRSWPGHDTEPAHGRAMTCSTALPPEPHRPRSTTPTTRHFPCAKGSATTSRSSASPSRQTWALRT